MSVPPCKIFNLNGLEAKIFFDKDLVRKKPRRETPGLAFSSSISKWGYLIGSMNVV
jgi:hypothetical protein